MEKEYGYNFYVNHNGVKTFNIFELKAGETLSDVESEFLGSDVTVGTEVFNSYEKCYDYLQNYLHNKEEN